MTTRLSDRAFRLVFAAILLLAAALRVLAFAPYDFVHADEVVQYLERAHRIVFGYGLVPWEARAGIRGALLPYLLAGPMALGGAISPDGLLPTMMARWAFALLCLVVVPAAYAIGRQASRTHGLVAMLVVAAWYESVLFGVHVLSESLAAALACAGSAALMQARDRRWAFAAGFLLALAVLIRLPYAAYVGTLVLLTARLDLVLWRRLVLGAAPALALGGLADLATGMTPFAWIWSNYAQNIDQGRAASFGTDGPLRYLEDISVRLFPAAIPIVAAAVFAPARYRPILAAATVNLVAHSLIGHKEYRFIWLSVLMILILAAIGSVELVGRLLAARGASSRAPPRAIAALCLGWCLLSLTTLTATGGTKSFREGRQITLAAIEAARRPATCGIAFAGSDRREIAYAIVRRPVPLYMLEEGATRGTASIPPPVLDAADALIMIGDARAPAPYRQASCRKAKGAKACLFLREGGCHNLPAAQRYTGQAVMEEYDM